MASLTNLLSSLCCVAAVSAVLWPVAAMAGGDDEIAVSGRGSGRPNITASVAMRDASDRPAANDTARPGALAATTSHGEIGAEPKRLVLSMAAEMSHRTSLVVERSRAWASSEPAWPSFGAKPVNKIGFEFRPVSAAAALNPIGALRVQVSDNSSVSLRPRRGGLLMSWRSNF